MHAARPATLALRGVGLDPRPESREAVADLGFVVQQIAVRRGLAEEVELDFRLGSRRAHRERAAVLEIHKEHFLLG